MQMRASNAAPSVVDGSTTLGAFTAANPLPVEAEQGYRAVDRLRPRIHAEFTRFDRDGDHHRKHGLYRQPDSSCDRFGFETHRLLLFRTQTRFLGRNAGHGASRGRLVIRLYWRGRPPSERK